MVREDTKAAMARSDCNAQRLFLQADLAEGTTVDASVGQANYVKNVLRLNEGDAILVFNGRDGEWQASIADASKRGARLRIGARWQLAPGVWSCSTWARPRRRS